MRLFNPLAPSNLTDHNNPTFGLAVTSQTLHSIFLRIILCIPSNIPSQSPPFINFSMLSSRERSLAVRKKTMSDYETARLGSGTVRSGAASATFPQAQCSIMGSDGQSVWPASSSYELLMTVVYDLKSYISFASPSARRSGLVKKIHQHRPRSSSSSSLMSMAMSRRRNCRTLPRASRKSYSVSQTGDD
jgi:hypothetical protein